MSFLSAAHPNASEGVVLPLASGEKVVNGPLVVAGHAYFGTNKPDTSGQSCSAGLGIATRYDVGVSSCSFALNFTTDIAPGGGFLPSPVAGKVEIDGKTYLFVTDNPLSPGGPQPKPTVGDKRTRAYWRQLLE